MDPNFDPKQDIYDKATGLWKQPWIPVVITIVAVAATAIAVHSAFTCSKDHAQAILFATAAAWAIGAPGWFFFEFYFIYRKVAAKGSWELFKHSQQVGLAIWAGVSVALYALSSSDLAKSDKQEKICTISVPSGDLTQVSVSSLTIKCK